MKKLNSIKLLLCAVVILSTMLISWKPAHESTPLDRFLLGMDQPANKSLTVSDQKMVDRFLNKPYTLNKKKLPPPIYITYYLTEYSGLDQQLVIKVNSTTIVTQDADMASSADYPYATTMPVSVDAILNIPTTWGATGGLRMIIMDYDYGTSTYSTLYDNTTYHDASNTSSAPLSNVQTFNFTADQFHHYYIIPYTYYL
jgi:hypothetical protein